ncbi:MAG: hypothetical protein ACYCW6_16650 [Candidatus Xenobia bacterium]
MDDLGSLEDVMRWMNASGIPRRSMEMVPQDEFSHDVMVPLGGERRVV